MTNLHIRGLRFNPPAKPTNTSSSTKTGILDTGRSQLPAFRLPGSSSGFSNLRRFLLNCMNCFPIETNPVSEEGFHHDNDMVEDLTEEAGSTCPPSPLRDRSEMAEDSIKETGLARSPSSHQDDGSDSDDMELIKYWVRNAYEDLRVFHGTNQSGLTHIRTNGMSTSMKTEGATVSVYGQDLATNSNLGQQAARYNFVTKDKALATMYANTSSIDVMRSMKKPGANGVPKLVRLFQTSDFPKIEKDPDSLPHHLAYRTNADIPPHAVRQEKGSGRYSEEILAAFQNHIRFNFDVSLSTGEIEQMLLDAAESDSDKDKFPLHF